MMEIVYHPDFERLHRLNYPKPTFESYETPDRVKLIWKYFEEKGYVSKEFRNPSIKELKNEKHGLILKKPNPLENSDIARIHTAFHIEKVKMFSMFNNGYLGNLVQVTKDIYKISTLSAGAVYQAVEDVFTGKNDCKVAFSINRPPGHHAIADEADGLCVFNNVAVAIEKLRADHNFNGRIAIVDIDAHYGDGLSKLYYNDPNVLYSSVHEYPFSTAEEGMIGFFGEGDARGTNIHVPIPFNANDAYFHKFCQIIEPNLRKFNPELIIVATGFDGHWNDPLGNLHFTTGGYHYFFNWVKKIADEICLGKIVFELEGGYNLMVMPLLSEVLLSVFSKITISKEKLRDNPVFNEYEDKNILDPVSSEFISYTKELGKTLKSFNYK